MSYSKRNKDTVPIVKLKLVNDYKKHMISIDKNDAMVGNYPCIQKTYGWTTIFFLNYLEETV